MNWTQRFDLEQLEDEQDRRRLLEERYDRLLDYTPVDPCPDCGTMAREVEVGRWQCECVGRAA